jgi:hypothetical protein
MRSQSTDREGPPGSASLASGRIDPPSVTACVATRAPSAKKRTFDAFHSTRYRCGAFSQLPGMRVFCPSLVRA